MEYFLYLLGGVIGICAVIIMIYPKKGKRIIYNLTYLLPFWSWGIIFLFLSALVWYSRISSSSLILSQIVFILFFAGGISLLFLPKRKIKKMLERELNLPEKNIRIFAIILLVIAFMIFLSV